MLHFDEGRHGRTAKFITIASASGRGGAASLDGGRLQVCDHGMLGAAISASDRDARRSTTINTSSDEIRSIINLRDVLRDRYFI